MSESTPLLKIRFEGEAVGRSTIPLQEMLRFLTGLVKALRRVGSVLTSESDSRKRGHVSRSIEAEVSLKLVSLSEGSQAAVMGFERMKDEPEVLGEDRGLKILASAFDGLQVLQDNSVKNALPIGYDSSVLKAWEDTGVIFDRGISSINFTLNGSKMREYSPFTKESINKIAARIKQPQTRNMVVEGRLLMVDFKEQVTRCRIHPSFSDPIICEFDEQLKDVILQNLLRFVRITGNAVEDPESGSVKRIKIHDVSPLLEQDELDSNQNYLEEGFTYSFWESPSVEELARMQGVKPVDDVRSLYGTWPGDDDDGFEEAINLARKKQISQRE